MANSWFNFKKFTIRQEQTAMKVTTDACLLGAWAASEIVQSPNAPNYILDIGTGTGLLALMIAQKSEAMIIGLEVDEKAAEQAADNVLRSPWNQKVKVIPGDAKQNIPFIQTGYDFIVCNPPFYENELASAHSEKNKAHHDTGLLLDEVFSLIRTHLSTQGKCFLVLPYKRINEIDVLFGTNGLTLSEMIFVKHSNSHACNRIMVCGMHKNAQHAGVVKKEFCIRNNEDEYTTEFVELLKDYYQNL